MKRRLGEILVEQGRCTAATVSRALHLQADGERGRIGEILVRLGLVSEGDVAIALAEQGHLTRAQLEAFPEMPVLPQAIAQRFLKSALVLPIADDGQRLTLAMADPFDLVTREAIQLATQRQVDIVVATPSEILAGIEKAYGGAKSSMEQILGDIQTVPEDAASEDVEHLKDMASEAPVIRLVGLIITRAMDARASDVHIEPFENRLIVRYRIDGVLHEVESPPKRLSAAIISRIKIMAGLDIAERRLPQDGRIKIRLQNKEIDLRVSTVPTLYGESVVLRILDKSATMLDFHRLGFDAKPLHRFQQALSQPHGIILVTGPTGSGKTTTLYAALQSLNKSDLKILTVEDPVEYQIEGINQIQVKPQIGLTFANALRSIVRQDPDVIMVGEIRDLETAQIAVQSALTGHLVLSTLHTNDAASTINRLLDMGVEDYLLTSTVIAIQAQRLVRNLCSFCSEHFEPGSEVVRELGLDRIADGAPITLRRAKGCDRCGGVGFLGRSCIVEVLSMTDPIRRLVMKHATSSELRQAAIDEGMETMYENGMRKALHGITTVEEVVRATRED